MLHIKNKQVRVSNFLQRLLINFFIIILSSKGCNNYQKGLRRSTSAQNSVNPIVKSTEGQLFTVSKKEDSGPESSDPEPEEENRESELQAQEQERKEVKEKLKKLQNLQKDQALSIQRLENFVHTIKGQRSKCSNCNCGKNYEEQRHNFENALQLPRPPIAKEDQRLNEYDNGSREDDGGYESDSSRSGDGIDDDEKEDGGSKQAQHEAFYQGLWQRPGIGDSTIGKIKQAYDSPGKILEHISELPVICGSKSPSRAKAVQEAVQAYSKSKMPKAI